MNKGRCDIQFQNLLSDLGKFSNAYLADLIYICSKNKS